MISGCFGSTLIRLHIMNLSFGEAELRGSAFHLQVIYGNTTKPESGRKSKTI